MTHRKRTRSESRQAGFTLMEALFSLLLMSLILAALGSMTAEWVPTWARGFGVAQRSQLVLTGIDRLATDIASAEWISAGANGGPIFEGGALSLTFLRTAVGPNAGNRLEVVRYSETSSEGGLALVRTTAPYLPGSAESRRPVFQNPVVILRSPYRVSFAYAGPDRVWKDGWQNNPELPRAVRVLVRDTATSRSLAVTTTAVVRAELPARCTGPTRPAGCPQASNTLSGMALVPNAQPAAPSPATGAR